MFFFPTGPDFIELMLLGGAAMQEKAKREFAALAKASAKPGGRSRKKALRAEMSGVPSLPATIGTDADGAAVELDVAKLPHALIAGDSRMGKSACVRAMLNSIWRRFSPEEVRFVIAASKQGVEYVFYDAVPHMLSPVITTPERALAALEWLNEEAARRRKLFDGAGARDFDDYAGRANSGLPRVVCVLDEFADALARDPKRFGGSVSRLTERGSAAGVHLILVTRHVNDEVITNRLKKNLPARIVFRVPSKTASRLALGSDGAEKLSRRGDVLVLDSVSSSPRRLRCNEISKGEASAIFGEIVRFIQEEDAAPRYDASLADFLEKRAPEKQ